ncbi:MAG TPA: hypothetical protein VLU43_02445 [Anaeromyxobacteraceae bacterium]|nr:hypothetical protein [Anaeromyxobacteraceae bacterium]
MNQHERILLAALLVASFGGLAGCDRFKSPDKSPARIMRVQLIDAGFTAPPFEDPPQPNDTYATDTWTINLTEVPINFATFRIDFSKPLNGSFIQQSPIPTNVQPTTAGLCGKSSLVKVTVNAGQSPNYISYVYNPNFGLTGPYTVDAQVCYNPSGSNPNITIYPGWKACAGVESLGSLEPGATYTIEIGNDTTSQYLQDWDGNKLKKITLTVQAAQFKITGGAVGTAYWLDPDSRKPREQYDANGNLAKLPFPAGGGAIATPVAPAWLGANGYSQSPVGGHTVGGNTNQFGFGAGAKDGYGTQIDLDFSDYMCITGYEPFCWTVDEDHLVTITGPTAADVIPYVNVGDDGAPPDRGGAMRSHVVPRLPLEDETTYTITPITDVNPATPSTVVVGLWADFNLGWWMDVEAVDPAAPFSGTFTTTAGTARVAWSGPLQAAVPGTGLGNQYLTLDSWLISNFTGTPFFGVAASEPLTGGTLELVAVSGPTITSPVTVTTSTITWTQNVFDSGTGVMIQKVMDTRGRTLQLDSPGLPLESDTVYTVNARGMTVAAGSIADFSYSFRTLPFDKDPTVPGFFGGFNQAEYTSSSAAHPGVIVPNAGNVPVNFRRVVPLYAINIPAAVDYDTTAASTGRVAYSSYDYLVFPFRANGGSIKLYAQTGVNPDGSAILGDEIPLANAGYLKPFSETLGDGTDPWDPELYAGQTSSDFGAVRAYAGSHVGVRPAAMLDNNTAYVLVAEVFPLGTDLTASPTPKHIELPFRTIPFRVASVRATQYFPGSSTPDVDDDSEVFEELAVGVTLRTGSRNIVLLSSEDQLDDGTEGVDRYTSRALVARVTGPADGWGALGNVITYDPPTASDAIQMYRTDKVGSVLTQTQIPIVVAQWREWLRVYPEKTADVKPTTQYLLVLSNGIKRTSATPGVGTIAVAPQTISFRTADQKLVPKDVPGASSDPTDPTTFIPTFQYPSTTFNQAACPTF